MQPGLTIAGFWLGLLVFALVVLAVSVRDWAMSLSVVESIVVGVDPDQRASLLAIGSAESDASLILGAGAARGG